MEGRRAARLVVGAGRGGDRIPAQRRAGGTPRRFACRSRGRCRAGPAVTPAAGPDIGGRARSVISPPGSGYPGWSRPEPPTRISAARAGDLRKTVRNPGVRRSRRNWAPAGRVGDHHRARTPPSSPARTTDNRPVHPARQKAVQADGQVLQVHCTYDADDRPTFPHTLCRRDHRDHHSRVALRAQSEVTRYGDAAATVQPATEVSGLRRPGAYARYRDEHRGFRRDPKRRAADRTKRLGRGA